MPFFSHTTYRLVSSDQSVVRIWTMYQRINPNCQELELGNLLTSLLPEGVSQPFGNCGLIVSAMYEHIGNDYLHVLEFQVDGKGLPAPSIFTWLVEKMGASLVVNYRMEAPEVELFLLRNVFFGFGERYYVRSSGLFDALEGAYSSLDELFQGWSDETGQSLEGLTTEEKISFINSFTDYESDDDSLFVFPFLQD